MQKCMSFGLLALASLHIGTAGAKDQPMPSISCPIEGQLRVASAATLSGFQMLDTCTADKIVIAPASVRDYVEPQDLRTVPDNFDAPRARRIVADADTPNMLRIVPKSLEPGALELADTSATGADVSAGTVSANTILSMRPISYSTPYDSMIARVAERHRIDPLLLHAVIKQESQYKLHATSPVGARGLMQLMPGTARMLGIGAASITDAESNVDGGARLLRRLHGRFNQFPLVLAAYNAGEGAVAKYGNRIPPYAETQQYVQKVMANYQRLLSEQSLAGR